MKKEKKRKYLELDGVRTQVQWGKHGGDLRVVVLIPRKRLQKRWESETRK